jgi:tRNA-specific 2-thiouridylase
MNIAALISGGVDSSVVVHLLKEQGYHPHLFYLKISNSETDCSWQDDIEICRIIAKKYGCELEILDLNQEYWDSVVSYMIESLRIGRTPNPDMMCNKYVKFGYFEQIRGKDFDKTATGHYATTIEKNGKIYLATAKDSVKDQTDFLAQIDYLQVSKLMFPIGHLLKSEVRSIAEQAGLATATRKDSQGICFLGRINYNEFIKQYLGTKEGDIIEFETGKKLGKHNGYWFHTIGQRKGLGIAAPKPYYVCEHNVKDNTVILGSESDLLVHTLTATDINLIPFDRIEGLMRAIVKVRYRQKGDWATVRQIDSDTLQIVFDAPQKGVAKGQAAVLYDGDCVMGGGTIIACM